MTRRRRWRLLDVLEVLDDHRSGRVLNIGAGRDRVPGAVNVDLVPLPEVEVAASIVGTLPFRDGSFGTVLCRDVLEHVDAASALREVHRVLEPGGTVVISTVHFTSSDLWVDPTHLRAFSVQTFDFFAEGDTFRNDRSYAFDFRFSSVDAADIQFSARLGNGRFFVWDRIVERLVNVHPKVQVLYEKTFLSRLFPAANVIAVLRK